MSPIPDPRPRRATPRHLAAGLLCGLLALTSAPGRAAEGVYLNLGAGAGLLDDLEDSDGFTSEFWPGPSGFGSLGYKWRWLRVEGEVFYASFALSDQTGPGGARPAPPPACFLCGTSGMKGSLSALAFMANGYADLDLGERIRLFLGGGIGGARVSADYHANVTFLGLPTDDEIEFVDDRDGVLAYQAKAGLAFGVTDNSEIYLGYRYFATKDLRFNIEGGGRLRQDGLSAHLGEIGYRFYF